MISLICAMGMDRAIGRAGDLVWRISDDLRRFKRLTMGHPIIMGRKTYESIGRALPGRLNIVMTRNRDYAAPGCRVCAGLDAALVAAREETPGIDPSEIFVIGGGAVYAQALPMADRVYLTVIEATAPDADTRFPDIGGFRDVREPEPGSAGGLAYRFRVLERAVTDDCAASCRCRTH